jgi:hypothetical protein
MAKTARRVHRVQLDRWDRSVRRVRKVRPAPRDLLARVAGTSMATVNLMLKRIATAMAKSLFWIARAQAARRVRSDLPVLQVKMARQVRKVLLALRDRLVLRVPRVMWVRRVPPVQLVLLVPRDRKVQQAHRA